MEEVWYTGIVKFFNHKSKFGFIKVDQTGDEIYVHSKNCEDVISDNDTVSFQMSEAKRGPFATQVKKISPEESEKTE